MVKMSEEKAQPESNVLIELKGEVAGGGRMGKRAVSKQKYDSKDKFWGWSSRLSWQKEGHMNSFWSSQWC